LSFLIAVGLRRFPSGCQVSDRILGHQIEFLDNRLTMDLRLSLHAIHSPFYWWIVKKTILFSGFKNPYKIIRETRKLESIHE
jgi:hypothetical protein